MELFNNVSKKGGENLSLPKSLPNFNSNNFSNKLPDLKITTSSYEKEIPFFDIEEEQYPDPSILPVLNSFSTSEKKGPNFIRTDDYSKLIASVDSMEEYIKEAPEFILMLKNLKKNKDIEFKKYEKNLEDIQRKLIYIDNLLFEAMKE